MGIGIKNNGGASKVKIDGINPSKRIELESLGGNKNSVNIFELSYPIKSTTWNGQSEEYNMGVLHTIFPFKMSRIEDNFYLFSTGKYNNLAFQKFNIKTGWDTNVTELSGTETVRDILWAINYEKEKTIYLFINDAGIFKFDGKKLTKCSSNDPGPDKNDPINATIINDAIYYHVYNNYVPDHFLSMKYDIKKGYSTSFVEHSKGTRMFKFKNELMLIDSNRKMYKINSEDGTKTEIQSIPSDRGDLMLEFGDKLYLLNAKSKNSFGVDDNKNRGCYSMTNLNGGWTQEEDLPFELKFNYELESNFVKYKNIYLKLKKESKYIGGNRMMFLTDKNILTEVM